MNTHAIIVGADELSIFHYGRANYTAEVRNNVHFMTYFLREHAVVSLWDDSILKGSRANWLEFQLRMNFFSEEFNKSEEEHQLIIYMSGHGRNYYSKDGKLKTFFCFHDQMVSEQELRDELKKFEKNTRIWWIIDSCYAGGIPELVEGALVEKYVNESGKFSKAYQDFYGKRFDREESRQAFHASILFFGASTETDVSFERGRFGTTEFTHHLIEQMDTLGMDGEIFTYYDLYNALENVGLKSGPMMSDLGTEQTFFKSKQPLSIN